MPRRPDPESLQQKLAKLPSTELATQLLRLAERDKDLHDHLTQLVAGPKEKLTNIKARLRGLARTKSFVDWRGAPAFGAKLSALLKDIESTVTAPEAALELVAQFIQSDRAVFESCDDSGGHLGIIFNHEAAGLFARLAAALPDKDRAADLLVQTYSPNRYGARDGLIEAAAKALPPESLRTLVTRFREAAAKEKDDYDKRNWFHGLEVLAKALNDPRLLELLKREFFPQLHEHDHLEIAAVWLASGDAATALRWIETAPAGGAHDDTRDELLLTIYRQLGQQDKLDEVAWRTFRSARSKAALDTLLTHIGEQHRERVTSDEIAAIMRQPKLNITDAAFLGDVAGPATCETYLLHRASQIEGDFYFDLVPLAQMLADAKRSLGAVVIYRALLDSILRRALSKYYHHGVRYLKLLDRISPAVTDWQQFPPHQSYLEKLRSQHARKTAFWAKYQGPTAS